MELLPRLSNTKENWFSVGLEPEPNQSLLLWSSCKAFAPVAPETSSDFNQLDAGSPKPYFDYKEKSPVPS